MTSKTHHYIELSDVLGFRFECKYCGAATSYPVDAIFNYTKISTCPSCTKPWVRTEAGSSIEEDISTVVQGIRKLRDCFPPKGKFESNLLFLIEIAPVKGELGV
jgi:hypothetical protein